jgi:hypothetical protein
MRDPSFFGRDKKFGDFTGIFESLALLGPLKINKTTYGNEYIDYECGM